jgi:hypothetical protein
MLTAAQHTAQNGIVAMQSIKHLRMDYKHRIRAQYRFYSQDRTNNLFSHPYTWIKLPLVATLSGDSMTAGETRQ